MSQVGTSFECFCTVPGFVMCVSYWFRFIDERYLDFIGLLENFV